MNEKPDGSRELDLLILEFESWQKVNVSGDIEAFVKEKKLTLDTAERLRDFQQMDNRLSIPLNDRLAGDEVSDGQSEARTIGNYRLEKKLGVGGMGTVWLAQQSEPVSRKVAIKLIRNDRDSDITARRFEREKQALALMSHVNVAQVYDAGIFEDNRPYIAMEYVDGERITDYCQSRQLPLSIRLELFLQLCAAIQHAHQNGLLHRDIKPANVLVTEVDGKPTVKVIDFGLVRPSEPPDPKITETDMIVGSPLWMSPEQAGGFRGIGSLHKENQVDTRADVYSLGVMLYQLLTDTTPIAEEYYDRATKLELLQTIQDEVPELPSARVGKSRFDGSKNSTPVSSWANVLRNELDWVTMRALEKDRERRYSTVAAFADDVQNYLSNEPVVARPPSLSYRLKKLAQRNRAAALAAGVVLGLLLVSSLTFAMLFSRSIQSERAARKAETEARIAEKEARIAEKAAMASEAKARMEEKHRSRSMKLMLESATSLNPSANGAVLTQSQLNILDQLREELDANSYTESPLAEAEFRLFLADHSAGAGEHYQAVAQYKKAINIYEQNIAEGARPLLWARLKLAEELSFHLDAKAKHLAEELFRQASDRFGERDPVTLASRVLVNQSSIMNGATSEVLADLRHTAALAKEWLGESDRVTINAIAALGKACRYSQRHVEADKHFDEALKLATSSLGPNSRLSMDLQISKLRQASRLGGWRPDDAKKLKVLLDETAEKFGFDHLFAIRIRLFNAYMAMASEDFDSAEKQLDDIIDDSARRYGALHRHTLQARDDRGRVFFRKSLRKQGEEQKILLEKAEEVCKELINDYETLGESDSPRAIKVWADLARGKMSMRWSTENIQEALQIVERIQPKAKGMGGLGRTIGLMEDIRARCLFQLDRQDEALEYAKRLYEESLALEQPSGKTLQWASFVADASEMAGKRKQSLEFGEVTCKLCSKLYGVKSNEAQSTRRSLCAGQLYLGDYEAAEQSARKIIKDTPENPNLRPAFLLEANFALGLSLCEQGKLKQGREVLSKACESVPEGPLKLYEIQARAALAYFGATKDDHDMSVEALSLELKELRKLEGATPPRHRWFLPKFEERLRELEGGDSESESS